MSSYSRGYDLTRIGIIGMAACAAFIGLFLYMTNRGLSLTRYDVFVRMSTAAGLKKSDPVVYRGVGVGEVKDLDFLQDGSVLVRIKLLEPVPLTTDARAELVPLDLFGRQSLKFVDGSRFAPKLEASDTIMGSSPPNIGVKMADLGARAERMLSDSMVVLFHQTLAGSAAATQQIAVLGASVDRLVNAQRTNVTTLTAELAGVAHNINTATAPAELVKARGNLTNATARLDSATIVLASLMVGLEKGEGSAGKLLRDDKLYDRTESLLSGLEELVRDVKANPKRYINVKVF